MGTKKATNLKMLNKIDVLGVGFNPMTYDEIVTFLQKIENRKKYICFPDIYNIVRANEDTFLRAIYNNSTLTLPDGKPSQFFLKKKVIKMQQQLVGIGCVKNF